MQGRIIFKKRTKQIKQKLNNGKTVYWYLSKEGNIVNVKISKIKDEFEFSDYYILELCADGTVNRLLNVLNELGLTLNKYGKIKIK